MVCFLYYVGEIRVKTQLFFNYTNLEHGVDKMKIAVVTDSTAYLSPEEAAANNIHVVPIPVTLDGQTYREGVDISTSDFYEKMANSSSFPTTSQTPIGQLMEVYQGLADDGYDAVISIHLTRAITGYLDTVEQLAEQMKNIIKIVPIDSHLTVKMMGYLALEAAKLASEGDDLDDIVKKVKEYRDTFNNVFVVDDLQNLVRGGRLSNASAFVGSILKIKPLLTMHTPTHAIEAFEKVRSMKKAKLRCEQIFDEDIAKLDYPVKAMVIHANVPEEGQKWLDKLQADHPDISFELSYFGPVIGSHLGQGALALAWMQDTAKKPLA